MDNRPIGVFDSGLGGLTTVAELQRLLPEERVIYIGDTARTPYGSKSPETIKKFAGQIVDYLIRHNVKMIIIACNTATAIALDDLRKKYPAVPIIGVIEPTVKKVVNDGCTKVGVIATKATVSSDVYGKELRAMAPDIEVHSTACPAIVPLIEEGLTDTKIMELTVQHYLDSFVKDHDFEHLILGCTHYPLVAGHIHKLYPGLKLYSSSEEVVNEAAEILRERDMLASGSEFKDRYYASDISDNFIAMVDMLFKDTDFKIHLLMLEE
ncbi:MAG: glutamate racemase [Mogibacterium sp.]|nr:glutamate racemase [Mogibacterium sp.]